MKVTLRTVFSKQAVNSAVQIIVDFLEDTFIKDDGVMPRDTVRMLRDPQKGPVIRQAMRGHNKDVSF